MKLESDGKLSTLAYTPLMEACRIGDLKTAQNLLDCGADPNAKNDNGTTPFMYAKSTAVRNGDLSLLKLLLENGADINAKDEHGKTALGYLNEYTEKVMSFMKDNGAK